MLNDAVQRAAAARTRGDWVEAATILENELGDIDQAMACWKEVVAKEPSRIDAHDALQRLCAMRGDWATLATVLKHRAKIVPPDQVKQVLTELVAILRDQLGDKDQADAIEAKLAERG